MFDPLDINHIETGYDKHYKPKRVPQEPIIGSFIPAQREGVDHSLCAHKANGVWYDSIGFICSRCSYKRGLVP